MSQKEKEVISTKVGSKEEKTIWKEKEEVESKEVVSNSSVKSVSSEKKEVQISSRKKVGKIGFFQFMQMSKTKRMTKHKLRLSVSLEELKKHNKLSDFWVSYRGNVYDVTPFLDYHPGGIKILEKYKGADMSVDFGKCHSWVNGVDIMKPLLIGNLKEKNPNNFLDVV